MKDRAILPVIDTAQKMIDAALALSSIAAFASALLSCHLAVSITAS
jgi:hypothetical protein